MQEHRGGHTIDAGPVEQETETMNRSKTKQSKTSRTKTKRAAKPAKKQRETFDGMIARWRAERVLTAPQLFAEPCDLTDCQLNQALVAAHAMHSQSIARAQESWARLETVNQEIAYRAFAQGK